MGSRIEAVRDWAAGFPGLSGMARINATVREDGAASVRAEANEAVRRRYIDGAEDREVTFALLLATPWSEGADAINAEAAALGERFADWCGEQWPGNPPDLGEGCEVLGIEPVYRQPQLEDVQESGRVALYRFEVRITYRKEP